MNSKSELEKMIKLFGYSHLKGELQEVSKHFHDLAVLMDKTLVNGIQKYFCLWELLQSKDAAVRAKVQELEEEERWKKIKKEQST